MPNVRRHDPQPISSTWLRAGTDDRLRPQATLSYVAGATDDPLRFQTIPQLLAEAVAAHGSRDAAIFAADRKTLSWYDLQRQADDVAAALLALGIRRGNRVGIWAPNRLEWLLAQFGAALPFTVTAGSRTSFEGWFA